MSEKKKNFDCVAWVREVRARNDKEFAGLSLEERVRRIREKARKSPLWKKFHRATTQEG